MDNVIHIKPAQASPEGRRWRLVTTVGHVFDVNMSFKTASDVWRHIQLAGGINLDPVSWLSPACILMVLDAELADEAMNQGMINADPRGKGQSGPKETP